MKGPHVFSARYGSIRMIPSCLLQIHPGPAPLLQPRHALVSQSSPFTTGRALFARGKKRGQEKRDSRIKLIRYHLFHPLNPRPLHLSRVRYLRHWTIHRAWHLFRAKQRRAEERSLEKQYQSMYNACEALRLLGEDGLAVQDVPVHGLPGIVSAEPGRIVRPPGARDPLSRRFVRRPDGTLYAEDLRSKDDAEKETQGKQADTENRREIVEVDVAAAAQRQQEVGRLYRLAMEKKGIFQGVPIEYARIQTDTPPRAGWDHGWKRPAPALI